MKSRFLIFILCTGLMLGVSVAVLAVGSVSRFPDWPQWGRSSLHANATDAQGQVPQAQLAHAVYDPFTAKEKAEAGGDLLVHYQVPLVDNSLVFMEFKTGKYISCDPPGSSQPYPCGPDAWNSEIWNERAFTWQNGTLVELWNFPSDWKPEPTQMREERIKMGCSGGSQSFTPRCGMGLSLFLEQVARFTSLARQMDR
jgi:hypothetical protein